MTDSVEDNSFETTPIKLLKRFYFLQQERVETYNLFEEGFQAYLKGHPNYNFPLYKQLVHKITETFNKISKDIITIKVRLNDNHQQTSVSALIGKIQDEEQKKLEITVQNQLSRQNEVDHPDQLEHKEQSEEQKEKLKDAIDKINELLEELKYESEDLYTENEEDTEIPVER